LERVGGGRHAFTDKTGRTPVRPDRIRTACFSAARTRRATGSWPGEGESADRRQDARLVLPRCLLLFRVGSALPRSFGAMLLCNTNPAQGLDTVPGMGASSSRTRPARRHSLLKPGDLDGRIAGVLARPDARRTGHRDRTAGGHTWSRRSSFRSRQPGVQGISVTFMRWTNPDGCGSTTSTTGGGIPWRRPGSQCLRDDRSVPHDTRIRNYTSGGSVGIRCRR
jgi:hypothetical protein